MGGAGNSIGAGWLDMGRRSEIPTAEERAHQAKEARVGLPPVRYVVHVRFEKLFDTWRVTFMEQGKVLRECRFHHDHTLMETVRRGRGLCCLEDKQAFEMGIRNGLGVAALSLDGEQYAALTEPL